ncbi:MAG TPA: hypothetical protein VGN92_14575, partial [Mycobacterium sp.]|nr:hypothetical protein [Mycobacterium sp.]
DPNGVPITAEFFHRKSNPGKLLEFPISSPAILKIPSRVATCDGDRCRASERGAGDPRPPGATRRAEPGAQGQCE